MGGRIGSGVLTVVPEDVPVDDGLAAADRLPVLSPHDAVLHVANRLSFGATPELVEEIGLLGPALWIEQQLDPDAIDDPAVDAALSGFRTLTWSAGDSLADRTGIALAELRHATTLRAVLSKRQLFEQMVDFWTNHFNTWVGKSYVPHLKPAEDRDVIRRHALGRFSDLLVASAKSPAMLDYLDNDTSRGTRPNENYGREVLELHTVGVTGGYSEADVRSAAYALTGWTWDVATGEFRFRDDWHFTGEATVLGWSTPGRSGPAAVADGEALLDHLARHPNTARFLATKLARRFIGDDPTEDVIASTAKAYLDADTDITATLRHLFATAAFVNGGTPKLRRPFDLVVAALRSTRAVIDPDPSGTAARRIDSYLLGFGQRLFDEPLPTGYPDVAVDWLSTDAMLRRWSFVTELATNRISGVAVDVESLFPDRPGTAGEFVDLITTALLHRRLDDGGRRALLDFTGVGDAAPVDDRFARDLPLLAALTLATARGQHR